MANPGIPGRPPMANKMFFLAIWAPELRESPSREELLGLGPAGGLPRTKPPSLCT